MLSETVWQHETDATKTATNTEYYRYEEYEVELAEGIDVEELKTWDEFDLDDLETFASYEWLDTSPVSGDVTYAEWEVSAGCSDEEREQIEEDEIYDLEGWHIMGNYITLTCECDIIPVS